MSGKLNILVAVRVMGWRIVPSSLYSYWWVPPESVYFCYEGRCLDYCPPFSSDWKHAGQVVEKMRDLGWCYDADDTTGTKVEPHTFRFGKQLDVAWNYDAVQSAATFPLAVCKAALRAVGVSEKEIEEACVGL